MKKNLLVALLLSFAFNSYSQIRFESGYFINEANQKISCLIKNSDWKDNPTDFAYKLSTNGTVEKGSLKTVKEFSIDQNSKYVRAIVEIDQSSNELDRISSERNPIFKTDTVFLKSLIEGKASLYQYSARNMVRYFYSKNNGKIKQLVNKIYRTADDQIATNKAFRQQLLLDLKCEKSIQANVSFLNYTKRELEKFFENYNNCEGAEYVNYSPKNKRDLFGLTLRAGINNSSLALDNSTADMAVNFGSKVGLILGIEGELILPYNKNKWSIIVEPTFKSFKAQKTSPIYIFLGQLYNSKVNYQALDLPTGVRYYFFLNNNSKVFVNAVYSFNFALNSSFSFVRADGYEYNSLNIKSAGNFAFGAGFKYKKRLSAELRYQTNRNIVSEYISWNSDYKSATVMIGYSIF